MSKAIYKFNSGQGALLCSKCSVIIRTGIDFSEDDWKEMRGELDMPPQTCKQCSKVNFRKEILENPQIAKLAEFMETEWEGRAFVVGGWVRDLILGIPSDDIDIVVEGSGIAFAKKFAKFIGLKGDSVVVFQRFGTAKLKSNEWDLDFVGARKESYDPTSRNPAVEVGTIMDDLTRRDLTINAMAISLHTGEFGEFGKLENTFCGMQDLNKRVIQTPIDPDETFKDDPLRMLRAVRFAARFGFRIEFETQEAIRKNAKRLDIISAERINVELEKTLKSKDPKWGFEMLDKVGLLDEVLPELVALKGREKNNGVSHKDNFVHTLQVLQNVRDITDEITLLWTAVLHDIGKARVKKFENNSWTFHNHELVSERMINRVAERFKWSTEQTAKVKKITRVHGSPKELVKDGVSDSAIRRFVLETEDVFGALILFCTCDITTSFEDKKKRQQDAINSLAQRAADIRERDNLANWKNPVSGHWLMETLGCKPGKLIGETLAAVKEAILEGDCENTTESAQEFALEWVRKNKSTRV